MSRVKNTLFSVALALLFVVPAQARELNIRPITQQTMVWCWAAVSEMALRYFNIPNVNPAGNYQCGVVGSLGGMCQFDCRYCITPIGSTVQMAKVLNNYQAMLGLNRFRAQPERRLGPDQIINEIDNGVPVIAGISPSGMGSFYPDSMSEHVVLIVGYDDRDPARLWLKINDPMPYYSIAFDPYINVGASRDNSGSYWIDYISFADALGYKDTIILQ